MQLYDFPSDVEPEAHARQVALAMRLVKAVEDGLTLVGRNAHTLIGYGKPDAPILRKLRTSLLQSERHDAPLRTKLDGIVNQIGDDLLKSDRVYHCLQMF